MGFIMCGCVVIIRKKEPQNFLPHDTAAAFQHNRACGPRTPSTGVFLHFRVFGARLSVSPRRGLSSLVLAPHRPTLQTQSAGPQSRSAPRRERQVVRLQQVVAGDVDVDIVRPHEIGVDAWLRTPLECAHGEG